MLRELRIVDRHGWKYAVIPQPRGYGRRRRPLHKALGTRSMEEARLIVKSGQLDRLAIANHADCVTRDVITRIIAGRRVSVGESVDEYQRHRMLGGRSADVIANEGRTLDRFLRESGLSKCPMMAVESEHIAAFVNSLGPQTLRTRQWRLDVVRRWLAYCRQQNWLHLNPADGVAIDVRQLSQEQLLARTTLPFTDEEIARLLAATPVTDFWHGAVLLGVHYGLRLSTVAQLEECNLVANHLRVYTTKGKRVVHEPLAPEVIEWLDLWRTCRTTSTTDYLFPVQAAMLRDSTLSRQFRLLCERLGIMGKTYRSLRKTATNRRWSTELGKLGDRDKQLLMALVAKEGFRKVQQMLAHAPGSPVTENHYLDRT